MNTQGMVPAFGISVTCVVCDKDVVSSFAVDLEDAMRLTQEHIEADHGICPYCECSPCHESCDMLWEGRDS